MKKIALILALLMAIGGFAVAELEPTVTGSASIAVGFDLDQETWGIENDSDSTLTLTLVSGSVEKMGEGAWYGVLELSDFSIDFDDAGTHYDVLAEDADDDEIDITWGTLITADTPDEVFVNIPVSVTVPDVTAMITDGNLYFKFAANPEFDADYVTGIELDDDDEEIVLDYDLDADDNITGGFEVGGTFGPATLALSLGTYISHASDAPQVTVIPVEAVIGLDVAPLMVDIAVATALGADAADTLGLAVQVKADVDPLAVVVAFDYDTVTELYEISAGVSAAVAPLTIGLDVYYQDDLDLALGLDADLAPLTVGVDVEILNAIDALAWQVDAEVAFVASEDITVNAGFGLDSDDVIDASASVVMTGLIDPMTFTLAWEDANDLTEVTADGEEILGQVVFMGEISY
jgi:hypothetical protein